MSGKQKFHLYMYGSSSYVKMNKPLKYILNTFPLAIELLAIREDPDPVVRFFRQCQAATFKFSAMARKRSKSTTM